MKIKKVKARHETESEKMTTATATIETVRPTLAMIDEWAKEWKEIAGLKDCDFAREYALETKLTLQQLIDYEAYLLEISSVKVPAPRKTVPLLAISIIFKLKELEPIESSDDDDDSIDCGF